MKKAECNIIVREHHNDSQHHDPFDCSKISYPPNTPSMPKDIRDDCLSLDYFKIAKTTPTMYVCQTIINKKKYYAYSQSKHDARERVTKLLWYLHTTGNGPSISSVLSKRTQNLSLPVETLLNQVNMTKKTSSLSTEKHQIRKVTSTSTLAKISNPSNNKHKKVNSECSTPVSKISLSPSHSAMSLNPKYTTQARTHESPESKKVCNSCRKKIVGVTFTAPKEEDPRRTSMDAGRIKSFDSSQTITESTFFKSQETEEL